MHVCSYNVFTNHLLDLEVTYLRLILSIKDLFVLKNMSSSRKPCIYNPNSFCYKYVANFVHKSKEINYKVCEKTYQAYFGIKPCTKQ